METDLAKLRELEAKATKAPLEYRDEWEAEAATRPFWIENFADLKLACALRNAAPALLARREEIRAEAFREAADRCETRAVCIRKMSPMGGFVARAIEMDEAARVFRALAREAGKGENDGAS